MTPEELKNFRPVEDVQPEEWARLARARRTSDPKKLFALMPAYVRTFLNASKPPASPYRHEPMRLPLLVTPQTAPKLAIPVQCASTLEYIRAFDEANYLKKVSYDLFA